MNVRRALKIVKKAEWILQARLEVQDLQRRMSNCCCPDDYSMSERMVEDLEDGLFALEQQITIH